MNEASSTTNTLTLLIHNPFKKSRQAYRFTDGTLQKTFSHAGTFRSRVLHLKFANHKQKRPAKRPGALLGQSYLSSDLPGTLALSPLVPSTSSFMRLSPR
jgi:hypothetical protein